MKQAGSCIVLAVALASCGKSDKGKESESGGPAKAKAAEAGKDTSKDTPKDTAKDTAKDTPKTKPAEPKPGKTDPELETAIRAVVANCKIDEKGWASSCKASEHDKAKELVQKKTAIAAVETVSVMAHDSDANVRRYVAGLSYDTVSSHIGAPYFYKAVQDKTGTVDPETARRLLAALPKVEGQARFYLAPVVIHAALINEELPAIEAALAGDANKGLRNVLVANLMVFPRMTHFERIKAMAADGTKANDPVMIQNAIGATQAMIAPTQDEQAKICPWVAEFITSANLDVASRAAHAMIRCGAEYIDKLLTEGEARVAAGTFADPLSMAFRDICFTPVSGTKVAGSAEQCAKSFAFLEAVGKNEKLSGQVRGQALWNIYYQRRDRATLDLLRKYEKSPDPEIARQVRDAIVSLVQTYKIDDGKGVPPPPPVPTTWSTNATDHQTEVGKTFSYTCPPKGTAGSLYGTATYTHDSSICTAAVHMGKIKLETGGPVKIVIKPGLDKYEGSEKNGVRSSAYGKYPASFQVQ